MPHKGGEHHRLTTTIAATAIATTITTSIIIMMAAAIADDDKARRGRRHPSPLAEGGPVFNAGPGRILGSRPHPAHDDVEGHRRYYDAAACAGW